MGLFYRSFYFQVFFQKLFFLWLSYIDSIQSIFHVCKHSLLEMRVSKNNKTRIVIAWYNTCMSFFWIYVKCQCKWMLVGKVLIIVLYHWMKSLVRISESMWNVSANECLWEKSLLLSCTTGWSLWFEFLKL